MKVLTAALSLAAVALLTTLAARPAAVDSLEAGFRNPPPQARPHTYWLWLNGFVDPESARAELRAMKEAGLSGVLQFDMGARGEKSLQPPAGPAFLSPPWMKQFQESVRQANQLGLQFDFSVISSWDLGGHWIEPRHGSMGLYTTEATVEGDRTLDLELPFPAAPPASPKGPDGKPVFWTDVAVMAARNAPRQPGHEFVWALDPPGIHNLEEAVLDNGTPRAPAPLAATMTPVREFSLAISTTGTRDADFHEIVRGTLPAAAGPTRFPILPGTRARYVRLLLLSGHDAARPRWTLGEFSLFDQQGDNVMAARVADTRRNGAIIIRAATPLGYDGEWNLDNLNNGSTQGPRGVFSSAGLPQFAFRDSAELIDVTDKVGRDGHLRWDVPAGTWSVLRYVCLNTGERLKVPSPNSDGWATDHLNPEATHAHMRYVIDRLKETFGSDLKRSGVKNLYLASYEVRGPVWSPGFTAEFRKRRGYDMAPYLPAIFGSRIGSDEDTERFLFDYRKTLGEVLVDAYYRAARDDAHAAGLLIKSEAGGPGPPVHNVPVDALLANSAVDSIQGEFWPYWPKADGLWVVKEPASAGHIYDKQPIHLESFTSMENWREGPQDLKSSADRVFCEGGNHFVWHTWTHNAPQAGLPGWGYYAGTHLTRNVTWWPKVKPFIDYLSRGSYLLQRGKFVAEVLYYQGDGGYKFVGPRRNPESLGAGYDYDVANTDVILNRLDVRGGRLVLPDGMSYAVLVLPEAEDMPPAVLAKLERLVSGGATVIGPRPQRASGLEGYPASDATVRDLAARLWGDLDGRQRTSRTHGKGRVIWGIPPRQILAGMHIAPDFSAPEAFDYTHRRDGATDIYFVRNLTAATARGALTLRTSREPEFWDAVTGQIRPAPYTVGAGVVEIPVELAANGSVFLVCRHPARAGGAAPAAPVAGTPLPIEGEWTLEFQPDRGAPPRITLPALTSWTAHADPGVRYFSGSAKYRKHFTLPAGWRKNGSTVQLDLGRLWTIGEAWLNGKSLGIVWTAPFTLDCTAALRDGDNELVVEVVNTWSNRLIGDARDAGPARITRTNVSVSGGKPWKAVEPNESGLFGPVRLVPLR